MKSAKTIAILLPDLRHGGAEWVHLQLAKFWIHCGFEVEFVVLQRQGELLARIPGSTTIVDLTAKRVRHAFFPLARYLRDKKPDAVLAVMWPLTVIAPAAAMLARFRGRVVVSEHAPQSLSYAKRGKMHGLLMQLSMRAAYPVTDARIGVSSGVANDMAALSGMSRESFTVVHNPAASSDLATDHRRPSLLEGHGGPVVLSVGTLKVVKRHDLLIQAFAKAAIPGALLCILGEGPERQRLERLVERHGLQGRVLLPGHIASTAPWYAHSNLFVLSSDHEGFGNVIVEALQQGTPVVSTDCPSGPREILADGKYGTLVPVGEADALARAMGDALSRRHDHETLKRRAQDFGVDKAADAYLDLLLPGWRERKGQAGEGL